MVYREGLYIEQDGIIEKDGLLSRMVYREEWYTEKDGILGRMVYRKGWYIEQDGI